MQLNNEIELNSLSFLYEKLYDDLIIEKDNAVIKKIK